jgi:hypothetical protein
MNPAVYADPQVIPQLVPPRTRGRPTLYSPELIDEFCGLIVDGMTQAKAAAKMGGPSQRTFHIWLEKYPEFRRKYEIAVQFRNQCWMDDTVDIADDTASDAVITVSENGTYIVRMVRENTAQRKLKCECRWKQLNGMGLKATAAAQPGDNANFVGEEKIVEHDPVRGALHQWELEYQKREQKREKERIAGNGQGWR